VISVKMPEFGDSDSSAITFFADSRHCHVLTPQRSIYIRRSTQVASRNADVTANQKQQ